MFRACLKAVFLAFLTFAASSEGAQLRAQSSGCRGRSKAHLDPFDCFTASGQDYVGLQNMGLSGRQCKNWITQGEYGPTDKGIGNHNYCRNPGGSKDKPWCFTVDPNKEWEYCEVSECPADGPALEPWTAPTGSKSESAHAEGPCEYEAPDAAGFTEWKADRACQDSRGKTSWLIGLKKFAASDNAACKSHCDTLAGSRYFVKTENDDDEGNNCGCYRECVLVNKDLTVRRPTIYKLK